MRSLFWDGHTCIAAAITDTAVMVPSFGLNIIKGLFISLGWTQPVSLSLVFSLSVLKPRPSDFWVPSQPPSPLWDSCFDSLASSSHDLISSISFLQHRGLYSCSPWPNIFPLRKWGKLSPLGQTVGLKLGKVWNATPRNHGFFGQFRVSLIYVFNSKLQMCGFSDLGTYVLWRRTYSVSQDHLGEKTTRYI